jgi:DNA-binding transcriptional regulator PaaX
MSLTRAILSEFKDVELNYKGVRINLFSVPKFTLYKRSSLITIVHRLEKEGYLERELDGWILTASGKKYMKRKEDSLKQFSFAFQKDAPKDLVVMFDIPETKKAEREWLRWHLKQNGYLMIQRSVWVGPSPLPKKFLEYIKEIDLKACIKTFKLAKPYTKKG